MAIDRTMRSNPLVGEGGDIEIEIENPESVSIETEDGEEVTGDQDDMFLEDEDDE